MLKVYVENAALPNVMSDFHSLGHSKTLLCNAEGEILVLGAETQLTFRAAQSAKRISYGMSQALDPPSYDVEEDRPEEAF
jgi:hypothetical protein